MSACCLYGLYFCCDDNGATECRAAVNALEEASFNMVMLSILFIKNDVVDTSFERKTIRHIQRWVIGKGADPLIRIEGTYINHLKDFKDTPF